MPDHDKSIPTPAIWPEGVELEDVIVELSLSGAFDELAANVIREQEALGLPITYMRGDQVIKKYADGSEEILAVIERPPYQLPKGVKVLPRRKDNIHEPYSTRKTPTPDSQ